MSRQDVDLDHGDHDYNSARHLYNWLLAEGEICPNTTGPTRMTACEKCVYDSGVHNCGRENQPEKENQWQ